ncbi:MAG: hypothetical protein KC417_15825, partial [Myxococcales bacterium]|nr:hypothetical protein [Myxococcales bacterium]
MNVRSAWIGFVVMVALGGCTTTPSSTAIDLDSPGGKADSSNCSEVSLDPGASQKATLVASFFQARFDVEGKGKVDIRTAEHGGVGGSVATVEGVSIEPKNVTVVVSNPGSKPVEGRLCVREFEPPVADDVLAAALLNLKRVSAEIDARDHLSKYKLSGSVAEQFLMALILEYADNEPQLKVRLESAASMVFFEAPDVTPPVNGRTTPFHGLDTDGFDRLRSFEDWVWSQNTSAASGKVGVRPFSVCETKYMIETFIRPNVVHPDFDSYKAGLAKFAASCDERDLKEWYNFRGLGHLRPSWVESNIMERVLRRMVGQCRQPSAEWASECAEWNAGRRAYRERVNQELASRFLHYDVDTQEQYFETTYNDLVLVEDTNGDGVGEFLRPGNATLKTGEQVEVSIESTGKFSGRLRATMPDGTSKSIGTGDLELETSVDPAFDPSWADRADFGLSVRFADDAVACTAAESPSPEACPLLKRFYVLIDRHESFYNTYSALYPTCRGQSWCLSSQPSPLVACSVTLGAANGWAFAGTPSGGHAGFIFLMRVPFADTLVG